MSGQRRHFNMGLVLLLCALTGHCGERAPSAAPTGALAATAGREAPREDSTRGAEMVKQAEESRRRHGVRAEAPLPSQTNRSPVKTDRGAAMTVVVLRDLRKKEKFLKHITGPLYFSPKCRKHVYRLYHHTRDCMIPAYFKRCARLLTRLAGSPQCTAG